MAGVKGKGKAGDRFSGVVGKRVPLLTDTEQKARGILRAIEDAEAAATKCREAAKAQEKRAEEWDAQVEELKAALADLPDEDPDADA